VGIYHFVVWGISNDTEKNIIDSPFEKCTIMCLITEGISGELLRINDEFKMHG